MTFKRPLIFQPGYDFNDSVTWKIDGVVVNLTGWTGQMDVINADTGAVITSVSTGGHGLTLGSDGTIVSHFTGTQTALIIVPNVRYVVSLVDTTTRRWKHSEGPINLDS